MSCEGQRFSYPGSDADPASLLKMAEQYRLAANALLPYGRRRVPISYAPWRLLAIHAIELHLNAFLRARGYSPAAVRGMQHNLAKRTEAAIAAGLILKKRTAEHLRSLTQTREYVIIRYDPELSTTSHLNRLKATLDEVATKAAITVNAISDCSKLIAKS